METNDDHIRVLQEIRDLLIPITAHYRPEYEKQLAIQHAEKGKRLAAMVKGKQARAACLLMDGTNDQASIREKTTIASGNLSPLISRLDKEGMLVAGSDRKRPRLIFSPGELTRILGGGYVEPK